MRALPIPHVLCAFVLIAPSAALACGGLFCNTAQPVNQAAERILFAQEDGKIHMHVRLTWSGPPSEFGWLLPAPADVETELSSEQLFALLDANYAPTFALRTELDPSCDQVQFGGAASADAGAAPEAFDEAGGEGPGVQVISREAVGPYDRAILRADDVEVLRLWLDENEYQVPVGADETLTPYIDMGAVFVALKLLPGAESNDVVPLRMTFSADQPTIPIRPTSVAADPDMGVIVHVLGGSRAVPVNYRHVIINEAAIDWVNQGQNYADVVSQAADEAGGHAFATDYAGSSAALRGSFSPFDTEGLGAFETWQDFINRYGLSGDPDYQRALRSAIEPPEGITLDELFQCPWCFEDRVIPIDGAAIAEAIETQVNGPRAHLQAMFERHGYITRLYSTLSAHEMTDDPLFDLNPDLEEVPNFRQAIRHVRCDEDGLQQFDTAIIETPSGLRYRLVEGQNPNVIQRQAGETVRGEDVPAAAVIEQQLSAGQPRVENDRRPDLEGRYDETFPESGCGCSATGHSPVGLGLLLLVLGLTRVRRRAPR